MDKHSEADLIFSDMKVFSDKEQEKSYSYLNSVDWFKKVSAYIEVLEGDLFRCSNFYKFMSTEVTSLTTQSVMVRKDFLLKMSGPFDSDLWVSDDIDLWFRLAQKGKVYFLNRQLAFYRRHDNNVTASTYMVLNGFITAHTKNLHRATGILDEASLGVMRKRIGEHWFHLGYYHVQNENFTEARRCYLQSAKLLGLRPIAPAWLKSWLRQLSCVTRISGE